MTGFLATNKWWSDEEKAIVRTLWFEEKSDAEIGLRLNRSAKSIQGQRRASGLVAKFHPERLDKRGRRGGDARNYTREDNKDILTRLDRKETIASIAVLYKVTRRAMDNKVDRLLVERLTPKQNPSSRKCLKCQEYFMSVHPKSIHRRCPTCQAAINEAGECMLSIYG